MYNNLFEGELVRLTAEEPEAMAKAYSAWAAADSEYQRMLDTSAASLFSVKKWKEWLEKDLEKDPPTFYGFCIRTLADDRLIGFVGLDGNVVPHKEAFVGIGIGDRKDWSRGYGTDAMRLALRYAFMELNLRRVSLNAFEYNPRGLRSYEKAGFRHEGRQRQYLKRDGKRWDLVYMGILREEWMEMYQNEYTRT